MSQAYLSIKAQRPWNTGITIERQVGWDIHQLHLCEHLLSDLLAMNLSTSSVHSRQREGRDSAVTLISC